MCLQSDIISVTLIVYTSFFLREDFTGGSDVKNLLAMQETRVRSLSWEELLQMGMATHSSILAWRMPWTEKPGGL